MARIAGITELDHAVLGRRRNLADTDAVALTGANEQPAFKSARQLRVSPSVVFVQNDCDSPSVSMNEQLADRRYRKQRLLLIESKVRRICMPGTGSHLDRRKVLQDGSARIGGFEISQRDGDA